MDVKERWCRLKPTRQSSRSDTLDHILDLIIANIIRFDIFFLSEKLTRRTKLLYIKYEECRQLQTLDVFNLISIIPRNANTEIIFRSRGHCHVSSPWFSWERNGKTRERSSLAEENVFRREEGHDEATSSRRSREWLGK